MAKKLLHTFGLNAEGAIVHVNDTEKGKTYTCPQCGERIVARNGGVTQRPHFAHFKKSGEQCNGESVLTRLFLRKLLALLQGHIDRSQPFLMEWWCPYCHRHHEKNLLKHVAQAKPSASPQAILLYNKAGEAIIAIETILRRRLTKKAVERYESEGILLIQLHLSEESLTDVAEKLRHPDAVGFCGNAECYNFQFSQHTFRREIFVQKFKCKKCAKVVDGYMVRNVSPFGLIGLDNLKDTEKQLIVSKHFRGKRATVADIVVYGKCRCVPHSKGLVCLTKSEAIQETRQGKITKKK